MPIRIAEAEWQGRLRDGAGTIHFDAYQWPYSFTSRFAEGDGTNPEALLAAAHAGCFTMALSAALEKAGFIAEHIHSKASVHLDKQDDGFAITEINLECDARVPGITNALFLQIANEAKADCPISRALAAPTITLDARLIE